MALAVLRGWQEERGQAERARHFVAQLLREPADDTVAALAGAGDHDLDHARWELRYARRSIGLLVAARDALDDRTSSDVAAELDRALRADPHVAADRRAIAERQFNDRLRAYRVALGDRTGPASTSRRLGGVLLTYASAPQSDEAIAFAAEFARATVSECNSALRDAYGEVSLPPDLAPSALRGGKRDT